MSSCWLCQSFVSRTLKDVMRHIGAVHSHELVFHTVCGIGGCSRSYTNFFSYNINKKHVYRKHRESLDMSLEINRFSSTVQHTPDRSEFEDDNYFTGKKFLVFWLPMPKIIV